MGNIYALRISGSLVYEDISLFRARNILSQLYEPNFRDYVIEQWSYENHKWEVFEDGKSRTLIREEK